MVLFALSPKSSVGWAEDAAGGQLLRSPRRLAEWGCCLQQRPGRALLWLCTGLSTGMDFLQVSSAGTFAAVPRGGGMVRL